MDELDDKSREDLVLLRMAYVKAKEEKGPFVFTPRQDNMGVWLKALDIIHKYKLTPEEYVNIIKNFYYSHNKLFLQHNLAGKCAENICKEYVEFYRIEPIKDIEQYIKDCLEFAANVLRTQPDKLSALGNAAFTFDPWVRIILSDYNVDIVKQYKDDMLKHFKENPGLEDALIKKGYNKDAIK